MQTLRLFSAAEEADCYHDTARHGFFSLLVANGTNHQKKQHSYRLAMMPEVLAGLDPSYDTWLSQAEFINPTRRVVNLARIGLLFADLDTYRTEWAQGRTPERQVDSVLYGCQEEGIPAPSLIVYSGRGLQAKWLLEGTIPRAVLPRWNACQRYLIDRLSYWGADPAAKDASRVLRIINTVNTKSGEICRVMHVAHGQDGHPVRYGFEYLTEMLLPKARSDIEDARKARRALLTLIKGSLSGHLKPFSGRQLAWDRLEDLRILIRIRGGVPEGMRMIHLFWHLNFLLLSGAVHSAHMYREAATLAAEIDPRWNYRSPELRTLYEKAKAHEAGETVEFNGKKYPPLYTPKNQTLIDIFRITDEEQRQLKTIISDSIAAERHRKRDEARRRAAGAINRTQYLEAAKTKEEQAKLLKAQGLSVRAIAEQMKISLGSVSQYINSK